MTVVHAILLVLFKGTETPEHTGVGQSQIREDEFLPLEGCNGTITSALLLTQLQTTSS